MLGRTDSRARLLVLLLAVVVASAAVVGRLAWWQVVQRQSLADLARRQTSLRMEIPSQRGSIYDRSGTVVLATTVDRDRIVAATDTMSPTDRTSLGTGLAAILGLSPTDAASLQAKIDSGRPYVILASGLTPGQSDQVRQAVAAGRIPFVSLEPQAVRVYPQAGGGPDSTLAAQLLGFVNSAGQGQYGVEQQYQDVLAGSPRVVLAQRDANSQPIPLTEQVVSPGIPGSDLRLTIDAGLQTNVEQELMTAWVADHPVSASAVVMDPYTGEVYAEASYPSYDANQYATVAASDPGRFVDPVISQVFEPGSVFKLFTVVAGLESGTVTPTTRFNDTGTLRLDGGRTKIHDADRKAMGMIELQDGIAYSRNVVAAKVALGLDPSTNAAAIQLFKVWTRFGFNRPTGIDLAGEVGGLLRDPAITPWQQIDLANGAFGQGVAVTPIQLATAYATMLNGGTYIQPHVVEAIGGQPTAPTSRGRVMSPTLTPTLTALMNHVVTTVPFYRDRTLIPGLYVGGKTGTAQIWDAKLNGGHGAWMDNIFNYAFIGFVGRTAGHPDLVIAIQIHQARPTIARIGEIEMPIMSFALFRRIATDAMAVPGLVPTTPESVAAVGPAAP